jgi:DNA-directed RNA polymerase subunit RPC12/RpoP
MTDTDDKINELIDLSYQNKGTKVTLKDVYDKEFENKMKDWHDEYEREHNIFCPYCNKKQSQDTMYENCVTYWGDDGDKEVCCQDCGKDFIVKEIVDRTFEARKIEEKEND